MDEYVAFAHQEPAATATGRSDLVRLIEDSARWLELALAAATVLEVAIEDGVETVGGVDSRLDRLSGRAEALCGRNPLETIREHQAWLNEAAKRVSVPPPRPDTPLRRILALLMPRVRMVVDTIEVGILVRAADASGVRGWGHRLERAHEALRSFLRRHEPQRDERLAVAGRIYADGRISIDDAAALLGMKPWDVVAEFEARHFCRPAATIELSEGERARLVGRLRQRRLSGARPPGDLVARDVIASQRIEGIDARTWVKVEES